MQAQGLFQSLGLEDVGVHARTVLDRVDALGQSLLVAMRDQLDIVFGRDPITEFVDLAKLPRGVDIEERKRKPARRERLARQMQHHRRVLADRIQHDRPLRGRRHLANDVDRLGLERLEMGQRFHGRRRVARIHEFELRSARNAANSGPSSGWLIA